LQICSKVIIKTLNVSLN